MNLTDNEIIKALDCCVKDDEGVRGTCNKNCPLFGRNVDCTIFLRKYALDLINRQKAEIERLTNKLEQREEMMANLGVELTTMRGAANSYKMHYEKAQAEIEKLKTEKDNLIKTYKGCMTEAIKEFDKKFKEKSSSVVTSCQGKEIYETKQYQISAVNFDNLVKEMVGD